MKQYAPDRRCLTTMRLIITAAAIIILAAVRYFVPVEKIVVITVAAVISVAFLEMFVHLPLYFSSIKYTATETEVTKSSGVFVKVHQSVRYSSIQYTTFISSYLSNYTGFNFIIFFVYGGQLRLLFLKKADAEEIVAMSGGVSTKGEKYVP
ncbi:PH domain-containing protein [Ruminococcus sp.]|uniref:PH domain-containing protein n=1 Tax=Ruminococcus sp. TaxID=41978 RepID=UPI0025E5290D|nr:PH domain-containing protein [Ruminococcus sp.]